MKLTIERLREVVEYTPEDGMFRYLMSRNGVTRGQAAGSFTSKGYVEVQIDGERYRRGRLDRINCAHPETIGWPAASGCSKHSAKD